MDTNMMSLNHSMVDALKEISNLLNQNHIEWSLGGSMMLNLRGIDVSVNDIDIIVRTNDIEKLEKVLSGYNPQKEKGSPKFPTSHFYEFSIGHIDIDVMVGFKVVTPEGLYAFDNDSKVDKIDIDGSTVYLSSLDEWLKAYISMKRNDKVILIKEHLNQ